jgi:hypothetical protein
MPADFPNVAEGWYRDAATNIVYVKFPLSSSVSTSVSL